MYNVISVWEGPMVRPSPKPLVIYTSGSAESSLFSLVVVGTYFQN